MTDQLSHDLVPDPVVQREFGVSAMTIWRWDHDPELIAMGWPPPIRIRKRNYRPRAALQKFSRALVQQSMAQRNRPQAEAITP